jgi:MFS family permease
MISGFAIAGYAFGALLGGDLIQRFFQRRLFLICQALFVAGCIVTATSHSIVAYGIGSVLEGFSTGLLLVIALPPVFQRFPPERVPVTVIWVNLGFFGAVCAGPFIGGAMAAVHGWRWFHGALGILGAANLVVAALTLSFYDPPNPEIRLDIAALLLGLGAVFLPFWATGELAVASFDAPIFIAPLTAGLVCFVALVLTEYHRKEALSPVARMWNTISLVGVLIAMFGGSVFVALVELLERLQIKVAHRSPFETGLLFTPLIGGVCVTAILLGLVVRTRYLPLLILGGWSASRAAPVWRCHSDRAHLPVIPLR